MFETNFDVREMHTMRATRVAREVLPRQREAHEACTQWVVIEGVLDRRWLRHLAPAGLEVTPLARAGVGEVCLADVGSLSGSRGTCSQLPVCAIAAITRTRCKI